MDRILLLLVHISNKYEFIWNARGINNTEKKKKKGKVQSFSLLSTFVDENTFFTIFSLAKIYISEYNFYYYRIVVFIFA